MSNFPHIRQTLQFLEMGCDARIPFEFMLRWHSKFPAIEKALAELTSNEKANYACFGVADGSMTEEEGVAAQRLLAKAHPALRTAKVAGFLNAAFKAANK